MTQRFISRNETLNELNSYTSRVFVNTGTSLQAGKLVYGVPYGGTLNITDASNYDNTLRAQFNANHTWQSRHQVTALGGVEIRETYRKGYSSTRYGFDLDNNTFSQSTQQFHTPPCMGGQVLCQIHKELFQKLKIVIYLILLMLLIHIIQSIFLQAVCVLKIILW